MAAVPLPSHRDQKLCESEGGSPGLPVSNTSNSPYGPCGRIAIFEEAAIQSSGAVRKSRWSSWAPVPIIINPYGLCGRVAILEAAAIQSSGAVWKWRRASWWAPCP